MDRLNVNIVVVAQSMLETIRTEYADEIPFNQRMDEVVDGSEYAIYYYKAQRLIIDGMHSQQQADAEWDLEEFGDLSVSPANYNELACLIACQAIKNQIVGLATAEEVGA